MVAGLPKVLHARRFTRPCTLPSLQLIRPFVRRKGARYERGCQWGSCERSVCALSGKSEWMR
jgi:hypothetical protein